MDDHMRAFSWLEENLDEKVYGIDTDDLIGLIEQVLKEETYER